MTTEATEPADSKAAYSLSEDLAGFGKDVGVLKKKLLGSIEAALAEAGIFGVAGHVALKHAVYKLGAPFVGAVADVVGRARLGDLAHAVVPGLAGFGRMRTGDAASSSFA